MNRCAAICSIAPSKTASRATLTTFSSPTAASRRSICCAARWCGPGEKVALEEPVYPGLKNLFLEAGAELIGVPVDGDGIDLHSLQRALDAGAKVADLTPSFQNPTGATMPAAHRAEICRMARAPASP